MGRKQQIIHGEIIEIKNGQVQAIISNPKKEKYGLSIHKYKLSEFKSKLPDPKVGKKFSIDEKGIYRWEEYRKKKSKKQTQFKK